jgi:hypothetical protein
MCRSLLSNSRLKRAGYIGICQPFPKQPLNNLVKATGSNPVEVIQIYTTIEIDGGFNQVMGDSQSPYVSILVVMVMTTG